MQREETRYALEIPYLGSLILTHSLSEQIPALKSFPKEDRPNSTIIFYTFRIMAGLGMLMIVLGLWSLVLRWRGNLYENKAFLRFALWMGPSGLIALLAGWFTTEIGRQPWVVYGLLRTKDAVSSHGAMQMSISLLLFVVIYSSVFGVGYLYMMKLIRKGPQPHEGQSSEHGGPGQHRTPARPLSAIKEPLEDESKGV